MAVSSTTWTRGRKKTGGRRAGTPNKVTAAHRAVLAELKVDRRDPLSFFLSVLRNPATPFEHAMAAAKEAVAYCHPKLSSIEARGGEKTHEQRLEELNKLLGDD